MLIKSGTYSNSAALDEKSMVKKTILDTGDGICPSAIFQTYRFICVA
jgi:hypothetical protein